MLLLFACNTGETDKKIDIHESEELELNTKKKKIHDFFNAYEANFNRALAGDTSGVRQSIAASFASCFVETSPSGVNCGQNDEFFLTKISQGFAFYKNIGSRSMKITSKNIDKLDNYHSLVKVKWHYTAKKNNKELGIDFEIFYLLRSTDDKVQIVAYITGDEQKALRENGLTP